MPGVLCMTLSFPPTGYLPDPASCPFLSLYTFCILTIVSLQSLIAHSRGKSLFHYQQKETRDRLVKDARLRREVTAQVIAAQQRVVELTPLTKEANSLWLRVVEAHRHADKAERAFKALSVRSWRDNEEAAKVRKERDELLQMDVDTRQRILDLLAEVEKERELKLGAEEKFAALEKRASLDATAIARLRKEQDELLQTTERLCSEHGVARKERDQDLRECDQACQERDNTQQKVGSL